MKVNSVLYPLAPHTSLVPYAHPLCALFTLAFLCSSIHQVLSWTSQSQGALCMIFFLPGWFSTSLLTDQFLRSLFKGHPPPKKSLPQTLLLTSPPAESDQVLFYSAFREHILFSLVPSLESDNLLLFMIIHLCSLSGSSSWKRAG